MFAGTESKRLACTCRVDLAVRPAAHAICHTYCAAAHVTDEPCILATIRHLHMACKSINVRSSAAQVMSKAASRRSPFAINAD